MLQIQNVPKCTSCEEKYLQRKLEGLEGFQKQREIENTRLV